MRHSMLIFLLLGCCRCISASAEPGPDIVEQLQAARRIGNDEMSTTQRIVRPAPKYTGHFTRFERFDGHDFTGWTVTGDAFGTAPTQEGEWDSLRRGPRTIAPGVAHSGLLAVQLRGTLRSRTFVIRQPFIDYLAAGRHGHVRLVVERGGGAIDERIDTAGGAYAWRRQDVSRLRGQRACIEIIDDDADDGWIAVDEIVFTDGAAPPPPVPPEMPKVDALKSSPALAEASARLDALAAKLAPKSRRPSTAPARP